MLISPDTYVLGKPEQLSVNIRVTNNGEDAFESAVYIPVPTGLLYNKFVALENTTGWSLYLFVYIGSMSLSSKRIRYIFRYSKEIFCRKCFLAHFELEEIDEAREFVATCENTSQLLLLLYNIS